ncbi:hypothetical protein B0T25DRAFT_462193 [Lasiosphaeria hispida]|uniref:AMP-dependent synthetase/ligase domain-containing protein n=1 Tax=Lasiosphaeria hispida TaxID=260671 RepID=A0AAJ0HCK5_9PEZI|nr:hypothetical protein B0T25DRAFT_462193 [Lasiosphaeria hispida]
MAPSHTSKPGGTNPDQFPPCLFPALNHSQQPPLPPVTEPASRFGSISEAKFLVSRQGWHASDHRIDMPTVCKAAWMLTLQCFVQTDILCFAYQEATAAGDARTTDPDNVAISREHTRPGCSNSLVLYLTRIDIEEDVSGFLWRLERSPRSTMVAVPLGHEIQVVGGQSAAGDFSNTILYYKGHDNRAELRAPRVTDGNQPDVSMDIVASVAEESTGRVSAVIEFRRAYTSQEMATSVLRTFQHIASQMIDVEMAAPHRTARLRDIDVCSGHSWRLIQQLTASTSQPEEQCLHDIIVAQCRRHPNRTAVSSADGDVLTYGELDDLSQRLAHRLVQLDVRPETFVLSCFEKSMWAVVARLAILRAGGAYISVHAANPPAYLGSAISRTRARVLICEPRHAHLFRHSVPTIVEVTPDILRSFPASRRGPVCDTVRAGNACLVLFTSGSTGKPKGIVQTHRSYATAIRDYIKNLALDASTRFLSFDDYAFDISNLEFMVPLVTGGCCCVPGPMRTVQDLARNINILGANAAFLTPTVAVKLDPADVPSLRILCVGGEPLPAELTSKWMASGTQLINQYGMGEAAICCCYNDNISPGQANVGKPASGAVFVVDVASPDRLLPVGAVGELLMEGPHLARGYLDQAAARGTEAAFLETPPGWMAEMHPVRASAGARPQLYRSGDLGRWNHDGTIDYVGRKDCILKLDGCRIDALEVEHQARKRLLPQDTIVIDILGLIDGQEDPVLAAFLYFEDHSASAVRAPAATPRAAAPPREPSVIDVAAGSYAAAKVAEIKEAIADFLPAYMVPALFLQLSHVPQTASKKTDRKLIHHVGQKYHLGQKAERGRSPVHAYIAQLLPN